MIKRAICLFRNYWNFGLWLKNGYFNSLLLLVIPGLLLSLRSLVSSRFVNHFFWIYTLVFLIVASFLVVLDLGLYPHWGTRVNITAFNYIDDPVAMSASISIGDVLLGLLLSGSLVGGFIFLYRKLFSKGVACRRQSFLVCFFRVIICSCDLILPIRGGLDTSPLNLSSVAFSPKLYVNQAASNYLWNFAKSVEKRKTALSIHVNICQRKRVSSYLISL